MKKTKIAMLHSAIALLLCVSILIGSTFAWFTDAETSSGNIIKTGTLGIEMYWTDDLDSGNWYNVEDPNHNTIFGYNKWEPGYTDVKYIKLVNKGNLALNYKLTLTPQNGVGKLAEVINVYYAEDGVAVEQRSDLKKLKAIGLLNNVLNGGATADGTLLAPGQQSPLHPNGNEIVMTVALNMITSAGNAYQNASSGDFTVTALATQAAFEKDSFGADYDGSAEYPVLLTGSTASVAVTAVNGKVPSGGVTMTGKGISAFVPEGVALAPGANKLTLNVTPLANSSSNIATVNDEVLIPVDVHIDGVAEDNTVPIIIDLGEVLPKYLNMGNYHLFHVENGTNNEMTLVGDKANLTAHNQFTYDPLTGEVSVAMASFSEVAAVADTTPQWEGKIDVTWYDASKDSFEIANADQLVGLSALVGGMTHDATGKEIEGATGYSVSFANKTIKLRSNINLNGGKAVDGDTITQLFYPIGYYNNEKSYQRTGTKITSGFYIFEGVFDGNGHTISNFYQNTWEMKGDHEWYDPANQYYRDGMGLFGKVYGGTVKNLTVDHFSSDGEITTTGVIAAYADFGATFENISITNCNPRVYNIGNGGIVGCVGWYTKGTTDKKVTFTNITVDNTNKISALWGSYDVACGGIVGQYYPTSGQTSAGSPKNAGIDFINCHVAAIIDVFNDVCANYQYYAYRYAGMMIGSIRENLPADANGHIYPDMTGITAKGCTVHYDTWNDYYYCELVANSKASYTHDHQFSRLEQVAKVEGTTITPLEGDSFTVPTSGTYNYVVVTGTEHGTDNAKCYHFVDGKVHNHDDYDGDGKEDYETVNGESIRVENHRHIYLPFAQLFTGYGWGVTSKGITDFKGINTINIDEVETKDSIEKFETKFTGDFLYRVGNVGTVSLGTLFKEITVDSVVDSGVWVTVEKINDEMEVSGEFTKSSTGNWQDDTIQFSGTGIVKVTIQDYNYCTPTVLYLEVVDAVNATSAVSATENNVVLLSNISSGFSVSGNFTFYGNGFTLNYTGNGQYLNNGLKQGLVTVSGKGVLDNLHIKASIYPATYLYYTEVQKGPNSVDGDKTRYHYQLSAVVAKENATISNCYIYGGRNNVFVDTGNVTVKDTVLECGSLSNVQIQSNSSHTVTFENVTTIQHRVNATIGDTSAIMLGAGIIVGPDTNDNPAIMLKGDLKQYNWVNSDDKSAVSNTTAQTIIQTALEATAFNHTVNGKTASNLGIIYLNTHGVSVTNETGQPYAKGNISMMGINGQVYSLQGASAAQICSDYENADRTTVNGPYQPQFKYSSNLGGQYIEKTEDSDTFCYREGDTVYVMFPSGDSKTLDLAALVNIAKYTGQDLGLAITCKDAGGNAVPVTGNAVTLSDAGEYTITYTVTDSMIYDKDGQLVGTTIKYSWDVTVSVSLKDTSVPDAYFEFDATKQKMGYYKPTLGDVKQYLPFLAGLKIYDYNGKTSYLRFDGDSDFQKIAAITITGYTSNEAYIEVKLTDGGVINTKFLARADSGGGSTYTGKIKTSNNVVYFVNDGGTSNKDTTTTAAYWYVDYYKFTGNNGVAITAPQQTFNSSGSSASTPSGSFSTTIKYTVTYDANNGNCGQTVGYATSASAAVTLPTPTRSGYIFAGWYTATTGGTRAGGAGDAYTPTANVTLYAQWGQPCTVTYNANGGTCGTASERYTGTALTLPTPTRDGYWFLGWYDAANGGTKVGDAGAPFNPSGEITLYAHWQQAIKYTVTYNANGGTCGTASDTYEGTALTLPTPTRIGYTFNGWYTAASGGTKIGDAGATYIPGANITLYAQWKINSYTIKVTTNNATVKVNGTTVNNNGTVSVQYGTKVTVEVTYSENDSQSTTIKGTDGATYTSPFSMPAQNVTINATAQGCVTPDTLITLADGTQKRVDSLTGDELLLVWNLETGKFDKASIMFIDSEAKGNYEVIKLKFSDGTVVKVISEHGFWDYDLNRYVYLDKNAVQYIGHTFAKQHGDKLTKVELVDVVIETVSTTAWSPVTVGHLCYFTNGMLSMPGGVGGLFNIFEVDPETMAYDYEAIAKDIETYGLFTYEEVNAIAPLSEEMFYAAGGQYLKISIGKGNLTVGELAAMIERYSKFI